MPPSDPASNYPPPPSLRNRAPGVTQAEVEQAKETEALSSQLELQEKGLAGTKTLLAGAPGGGKTYSLATLIEADLDLFVLVTEPNGEESLLEAIERKGLPRERFHWAYVAPAAPSFSDLEDMARTVNTMSYEKISGIKTGVAKQGYRQFLDMLAACKNFKDQHGNEFGPVDSWGPDRAFCIDSLTGINEMAMGLTIGLKPAAHQGEWGVAMNVEDKFLMKCCADLKCFFVLTAHIERVMDETVGRPINTAAALGNKLAPKIPRRFSDFAVAYNDGTNYFWSTVYPNMDLKTRTLPRQDKLQPSFKQIVDVWARRRGVRK